MKKTHLLIALCLLSASYVTTSFAAARSPSNLSREHIVSSAPLSNWSTGLYYDNAEKEVELKNGSRQLLKSSKTMVYIGYDVLPWFAPYVVAGQNDAKIGYFNSSYEDGSLQYGLGAMFNLLDHEVADPTLIEDRLRLTAGVEYSWTSTDYLNDELEWTALDASLTASIVNDVAGNILFSPDSIAFFGGLIYSKWGGSDIKGATSNTDEVGYTLGLEVFYTPSVSFSVRGNFLEHTGLTAGINLRF
jgi:hypothetical protein